MPKRFVKDEVKILFSSPSAEASAEIFSAVTKSDATKIPRFAKEKNMPFSGALSPKRHCFLPSSKFFRKLESSLLLSNNSKFTFLAPLYALKCSSLPRPLRYLKFPLFPYPYQKARSPLGPRVLFLA